MKDEVLRQRIKRVLEFYADDKNYWGLPIPLDLNLDQRTLKIANHHKNKTKVLQDRGRLAREALHFLSGRIDG